MRLYGDQFEVGGLEANLALASELRSPLVEITNVGLDRLILGRAALWLLAARLGNALGRRAERRRLKRKATFEFLLEAKANLSAARVRIPRKSSSADVAWQRTKQKLKPWRMSEYQTRLMMDTGVHPNIVERLDDGRIVICEVRYITTNRSGNWAVSTGNPSRECRVVRISHSERIVLDDGNLALLKNRLRRDGFFRPGDIASIERVIRTEQGRRVADDEAQAMLRLTEDDGVEKLRSAELTINDVEERLTVLLGLFSESKLRENRTLRILRGAQDVLLASLARSGADCPPVAVNWRGSLVDGSADLGEESASDPLSHRSVAKDFDGDFEYQEPDFPGIPRASFAKEENSRSYRIVSGSVLPISSGIEEWGFFNERTPPGLKLDGRGRQICALGIVADGGHLFGPLGGAHEVQIDQLIRVGWSVDGFEFEQFNERRLIKVSAKRVDPDEPFIDHLRGWISASAAEDWFESERESFSAYEASRGRLREDQSRPGAR